MSTNFTTRAEGKLKGAKDTTHFALQNPLAAGRLKFHSTAHMLLGTIKLVIKPTIWGTLWQ